MGFYTAAVSLRQYNTNTHITQNNNPKTNKNKSAHKARQTVEEILQPMNTAQKKKRNKALCF
jgi:hypothetical protein